MSIATPLTIEVPSVPRATAIALAIALAGGCVTPRVTVEHDDVAFDEVVDHVEFDLHAGDLYVRVGDVDAVTVQRTLRYSGERPDLNGYVADGIMYLDVDCPLLKMECSVDHDIVLPKSASIFGDSGSGELSFTMLEHGIDVTTGSGDVEVIDVRDDVSIETGSGDVYVDKITGALLVDTGSGSITGRSLTSPSAIATTGSGDVQLTLELTPSRVTIDTGSGDVRLEVPAGTYDIATHTGSGDVSSTGITDDETAASQINIETGSGDIDITGW